ncbi:hypothetical protein L873DRAFT_1788532 [Choiromyces venosus 120613-1]|uniref:Uncharacterized protein n=1 Tax=Choiromyces venosus 120613-1 TaxID=1336337 RepID=A0A3N4JSA7_9PEZI|nr:hypothetical protein L873DRAFT_1788532 [Choiromyces venosus 120613-1]
MAPINHYYYFGNWVAPSPAATTPGPPPPTTTAATTATTPLPQWIAILGSTDSPHSAAPAPAPTLAPITVQVNYQPPAPPAPPAAPAMPGSYPQQPQALQGPDFLIYPVQGDFQAPAPAAPAAAPAQNPAGFWRFPGFFNEVGGSFEVVREEKVGRLLL